MRQSTAAVTARPGQIDKTRTGNHPGQAGDPDPWSIPLEQIDVSDATLFARNAHGPYFARLRDEDPVHYTPQSAFGPYWSVTRFEDIKYVDTHHDDFSSQPSIVIGDPREDFTMPMFIAMDRPKHTQQRRGVTEAVSPTSLAQLEPTLRRRVGAILDSLPVGEEFDWVKAVSIELTTQMLATLLDFPFEDRHRLTHWSDCAASTPRVGATAVTEEYRRQVLMECLEYFNGLWVERTRNPGNDFVSMMAHSAAYQDMQPLEYLGNLVLLIVAGNDTTRNSISGGVYALNQFPAEYRSSGPIPDSYPTWSPKSYAGRCRSLICAAPPKWT